MLEISSRALVLNKKEISENNFIVTLFTKDYGKLNCFVYGIKKSKKRDKASIILLSLSDTIINIKNGKNILEFSKLIKIFQKIYKNLNKINISMYILDVLNKILEENQKEEVLFLKIIEILEYIENLEDEKINEESYIYIILISFLRRIMIETGIFSSEEFSNNKLYNIYLKSLKNDVKLEKKSYINLITFFEKYINEYYEININYKKYLF